MVSKAHVLSASSPDFRDIITLQAAGAPGTQTRHTSRPWPSKPKRRDWILLFCLTQSTACFRRCTGSTQKQSPHRQCPTQTLYPVLLGPFTLALSQNDRTSQLTWQRRPLAELAEPFQLAALYQRGMATPSLSMGAGRKAGVSSYQHLLLSAASFSVTPAWQLPPIPEGRRRPVASWQAVPLPVPHAWRGSAVLPSSFPSLAAGMQICWERCHSPELWAAAAAAPARRCRGRCASPL